MDEGLIGKVQKWVESIYSNAKHLIRTGYWVKNLYPSANDALVIAAITHDIERAFKEGRNPPSPETGGVVWDDVAYDKWHSNRSAKFVSEFLKKEKVNESFINDVSKLIGHHERGGWEEADFLRDADSISFLEINTPYFLTLIPERLTKEEVKAKFDLMYNRIGSKDAKKVAQPFYDNALENLDKLII